MIFFLEISIEIPIIQLVGNQWVLSFNTSKDIYRLYSSNNTLQEWHGIITWVLSVMIYVMIDGYFLLHTKETNN